MKKTRVMIVEDEGLIANDIASQLQKVGYEVAATAASGEEALDILQQSPADLILMDFRLKGGLDGIDTALRVRSEHNLPVVFLTSHADVSHRNQEDVEVDRERKMLAVGRLAGRVATHFNKLLALIIGHGAQLVASISNPTERVLRTELDRGQFDQALLNLMRKARIATSRMALRL